MRSLPETALTFVMSFNKAVLPNNVGPAKYPTTSDLQSGYFFGQFCSSVVFFVSQVENRPLTFYCPCCPVKFLFSLVKVSTLPDLLLSEILTLLGKTDKVFLKDISEFNFYSESRHCILTISTCKT